MNTIKTPITECCVKALRELCNEEPINVLNLCIEFIEEAAAPNVWDEIILEKLYWESSVTVIDKCSNGYYQDIAEQVYSLVDIGALITERECATKKMLKNVDFSNIKEAINLVMDYAIEQASSSNIPILATQWNTTDYLDANEYVQQLKDLNTLKDTLNKLVTK